MKAFSIICPYGDLIISGKKKIEVRSWIPGIMPINNIVLIQNLNRLSCDYPEEDGTALAIINIERCRNWEIADLEDSCCTDFADGYFAWEISNIRKLKERIAIRAKRKIYELSDDEEKSVIDNM